MKIYIIWLIGVIIWNFGFPNAAPIADVIVAILLSFLSIELKIRSFVKSVTKTSFFMNQIITKGETIIVEAQVHLVFVNEKNKPVKVPEIIFDNFKPYFCDTIKL